ncbi:MAG: nucleoside hydrolase [Kiritimatiellaeota bacterium]|nr:nucleoside hydrolase [Kiritimatiellota bacterium]
MSQSGNPVPVILDTDIGGDIDDTWALAMMLKSPELDVKLVVSDSGDTTYRAKIIARMLEAAGRTDIPVGVGTAHDTYRQYPQQPWVADYDLAAFPGTVHGDGVGALIETIMESPEPVTLVCIGPVPNIGEALDREPRIAEKARFVGMHGSVFKGYGGAPQISAECNVLNHTSACQKAFTAPWDMTITPVDTCGLVVLQGEKYRKVRECSDPAVRAVMENYRIWLGHTGNAAQFEVRSSTLFDTVAIYLAFSEELLEMRELGIRVTDDGYTVVDANAKHMRVAVDWKNLAAFEDFLVERLTRG